MWSQLWITAALAPTVLLPGCAIVSATDEPVTIHGCWTRHVSNARLPSFVSRRTYKPIRTEGGRHCTVVDGYVPSMLTPVDSIFQNWYLLSNEASAFVRPPASLIGLGTSKTFSAGGARSELAVGRRSFAASAGRRRRDGVTLAGGERERESAETLPRDGRSDQKTRCRGLDAQRNVVTPGYGAAAVAAFVAVATLGGLPDSAAAEAPAWVGPTKLVLDPILLYFEFAFVTRIVLSWYPALDLNKIPQNLVAWPTEPILRPTRAVVPPAFGVDVSPIVWVMICSFLHEILLGQQGILNLISNK